MEQKTWGELAVCFQLQRPSNLWKTKQQPSISTARSRAPRLEMTNRPGPCWPGPEVWLARPGRGGTWASCAARKEGSNGKVGGEVQRLVEKPEKCGTCGACSNTPWMSRLQTQGQPQKKVIDGDSAEVARLKPVKWVKRKRNHCLGGMPILCQYGEAPWWESGLFNLNLPMT